MTTNPQTIFNEADTAARAAVDAEVAIRPENPHAFDCGFAWVTIPGNTPLARWCRAMLRASVAAGVTIRGNLKYGHTGHPSGWVFWKPGGFNGQSIRIHLEGSRAFCEVLRRYGIDAVVGSRLD